MDTEQLKQDLVLEIKDLAAEIAKSNTFVGLLSNEIKLRSLHEKFINLKFLERKHLGLDIFDQPIQTESEKEEIFSTDNERFEDEPVVEFSFKSSGNNNAEIPAEPIKQGELQDNFHETETFESEKETIQEDEQKNYSINFEEESVEPTAEENLMYQDDSESDNLNSESLDTSSAPSTAPSEPAEPFFYEPQDDFSDLLPSHSKWPKIHLDYNDKIAFLNQLFYGDSETMDLIMSTLNHMESLSDSRIYLKDLKREMDWNNKEEYLERLDELIVKRFE